MTAENLTADLWWSKLFRAIVVSGDLSRMSGSATKMYLSLKSRADGKTGYVSTSVRLLSKDAGISMATGRRAVAELKSLGYLHSEKRCGRASRLQLVEKFPLHSDGKRVGVASLPYAGQQIDNLVRELQARLKTAQARSFPHEHVRIELHVTNVNHSGSGDVIVNNQIVAKVSGRTGEILSGHLERIQNEPQSPVTTVTHEESHS